MCKICEFDPHDFTGDLLTPSFSIGKDVDEHDTYLMYHPDEESHVIVVNTPRSEQRFKVNFCPACGRQL